MVNHGILLTDVKTWLRYILQFIITYNTVILVHSVIKFFDRNFLFIEKVLALIDLIFFRALERDKIESKKARAFEI